ncbi:MAG: hypothetical protein HRU19_21970 [Pseudobacteriovorax sp.]|nr:hypothetical protein [Pseudobacteriovorax sp.]
METVNLNAIVLLALLISSFGISAIAKRWIGGKIGVLSGVEFVVIGILLGESFGLAAITAEITEPFIPLISLVIGLFGFLFGLEVINVKVKTEVGQLGIYFHFLIFFVATFCLFPVLVSLLPYLPGGNEVLRTFGLRKIFDPFHFFGGKDTHIWMAATLGVMMMTSSYEFVDRSTRSSRVSGTLRSILLRVTASGETLAIFLFGSIFAGAQVFSGNNVMGWTVTEWTVAVIGLGCFCGMLFFLFIGKDESPVKTYLATIGVVTLVSGMASSVGISPLFLNFVCGATLAIASPSAEKIASTLSEIRAPLSIMVLFFAGVSLSSVTISAVTIAIVYILARLAWLSVLTPFFSRVMVERRHAPKMRRVFYLQDVLIVIIPLDLAIRNIGFSQEILFCSLLSYLFFSLLGNNALPKFLDDSIEFYKETGKEGINT